MKEIQTTAKSDLGVRTVSAVVMVGIAIGAFWAGGWIWTLFLALIGVGLLWEFWNLVRLISHSILPRIGWMVGGTSYFGLALFAALDFTRQQPDGRMVFLMILCSVIATDIGAYFVGRTLGGPKIAPSISPSKTWSGLAGGMVFAGLSIAIFPYLLRQGTSEETTFAQINWALFLQASVIVLLMGAAIATVAQSGDFFESWMKRRAGVKDSGNLIPGHGGLFDRADGMIAVFFAFGIYLLLALLST